MGYGKRKPLRWLAARWYALPSDHAVELKAVVTAESRPAARAAAPDAIDRELARLALEGAVPAGPARILFPLAGRVPR